MKSITLPPPTPDQLAYLDKIHRACTEYDGSVIVGGPKGEPAPATGTFWVIETARQTYWEGRQVGDRANFTDKIGDAVKFGDFNSAEVVRCWLLEKQPGSATGAASVLRSVEHAWLQTLT
jgi:hypothetical protein